MDAVRDRLIVFRREETGSGLPDAARKSGAEGDLRDLTADSAALGKQYLVLCGLTAEPASVVVEKMLLKTDEEALWEGFYHYRAPDG